jgi:predicted RecB family endonuclease
MTLSTERGPHLSLVAKPAPQDKECMKAPPGDQKLSTEEEQELSESIAKLLGNYSVSSVLHELSLIVKQASENVDQTVAAQIEGARLCSALRQCLFEIWLFSSNHESANENQVEDLEEEKATAKGVSPRPLSETIQETIARLTAQVLALQSAGDNGRRKMSWILGQLLYTSERLILEDRLENGSIRRCC